MSYHSKHLIKLKKAWQLLNNHKRVLAVVSTSVFFSACTSTSAPAEVTDLNNPYVNVQRMDERCVQQIMEQQQVLALASTAQYLSLADSAMHCAEGIVFTPSHPDTQTAMQFSALAFNNYLKAGDIKQAQSTLQAFRQRFPQQDLFFTDYTSFVDTATVLVSHDQLSAHQLEVLNISDKLRSELLRQRKWLMQ